MGIPKRLHKISPYHRVYPPPSQGWCHGIHPGKVTMKRAWNTGTTKGLPPPGFQKGRGPAKCSSSTWDHGKSLEWPTWNPKVFALQTMQDIRPTMSSTSSENYWNWPLAFRQDQGSPCLPMDTGTLVGDKREQLRSSWWMKLTLQLSLLVKLL